MHMAEIRFVEKYWINMHQKMGDNSGGTCTVFRGRQLFFLFKFSNKPFYCTMELEMQIWNYEQPSNLFSNL